MSLSTRAGIVVPVLWLAAACGGNGGAPCDGSGGASAYCLAVGADDGGGGFSGYDANTALDARIEQNGIQVSFVNLGCAGACANVEAVATGGNPPYSFAWSDGSTTATRSLCPRASTNYEITVADTGLAGGEFPRPPETAKVSLAANVLACPDAGPAFPSGRCDSLAGSFSPDGVNPSGAWSYGWTSAVGAAFTLYPTFVPQELDAGPYNTPGFPSVAQWFDPSQGMGGIMGSGPAPDIQFNASAMPVHPGVGNFTGDSWIVEPGQIVMMPSPAGGDCSVARWTAPSAGTYGVKAAFASAATSGFTDTANVYVQHDGVAIASSSGMITAGTTTFSTQSSVTVAAGDTIDFVVAPGSSLVYRLVSVDAQVCSGASTAGDGG